MTIKKTHILCFVSLVFSVSIATINKIINRSVKMNVLTKSRSIKSKTKSIK